MVYAYEPNFIWSVLPNFTFFGLTVFCGVDNWLHMEKVKCGCTIKNLPLSNGIKSFLYSSDFMGKSCTQTLTLKCTRDTLTNTQRFWPPQWQVKSELHQTQHGDKGPRAHSCIAKTFGGPMYSCVTRGTENFWETSPPQLKTLITP